MKKLILIAVFLCATFVAKGQDDNTIHFSADSMPLINGYNLATFQRWVELKANEQVKEQSILTYGEDVVVSFVVERSGRVSNLEMLSGVKVLGDITLGIIMTAGVWQPATIDGQAVRIKQTMPVKFEENTPEVPSLVAEDLPTFNGGGLEVFRNWVQEDIDYPLEARERGIQGVVVLSFIIEKDGSVSNVEVLRSPSELLSIAAINKVKSSPIWTPAKQRGVPTRLKYTLPISFRIIVRE